MTKTTIIKGLVFIFFMAALPVMGMAANGKPPVVIKINYKQFEQIVSDTTVPKIAEKKEEKADAKNDEKTNQNAPVNVVKVIPKARRQPIPVPVKVTVHPVKIIKPKIIKPVVKPVIKILH